MFTIGGTASSPPMEVVFAFEYLKWAQVVRGGCEFPSGMVAGQSLSRKEQATLDIALTTIQQFLTGEREFARSETPSDPLETYRKQSQSLEDAIKAMFDRPSSGDQGDGVPRT